MEITRSFVFQCDADIVKQVYRNNDNYLIEYNEANMAKNICAIYFSSNDIYFPNNENVFRKRIVEKNAYEWFGTRIEKAYKHIFVRDIQKQWYLEGINENINGITKLVELLKEETNGLEIVTIGSSAGGYASVLFGTQLNASKILTFNGQFEIGTLLISSKQETNPLLFKYADTSLYRYYDLKQVVKFSNNIFYFLSRNSAWDIVQFKHIKDIDQLNIISFKTAHHGIPFLKSALPEVVNLNREDLLRLSKRNHSPFWFTVKAIGFSQTISSFFIQLYAKYKKRN